MTHPRRYYSGPVDTLGAIVTVFGWYDNAEWVAVRLTRKSILGWLVERVTS